MSSAYQYNHQLYSTEKVKKYKNATGVLAKVAFKGEKHSKVDENSSRVLAKQQRRCEVNISNREETKDSKVVEQVVKVDDAEMSYASLLSEKEPVVGDTTEALAVTPVGDVPVPETCLSSSVDDNQRFGSEIGSQVEYPTKNINGETGLMRDKLLKLERNSFALGGEIQESTAENGKLKTEKTREWKMIPLKAGSLHIRGKSKTQSFRGSVSENIGDVGNSTSFETSVGFTHPLETRSQCNKEFSDSNMNIVLSLGDEDANEIPFKFDCSIEESMRRR